MFKKMTQNVPKDVVFVCAGYNFLFLHIPTKDIYNAHTCQDNETNYMYYTYYSRRQANDMNISLHLPVEI